MEFVSDPDDDLFSGAVIGRHRLETVLVVDGQRRQQISTNSDNTFVNVTVKGHES